MRMLVTGGLGFIGSALIRKILNETDHTILNLDSCTYAAMPPSRSQRLLRRTDDYHSPFQR